LSVVGDGIPLIYNGQEAGNPRRLAFFEKDPIAWQAHPLGELYRRLFALKKQHSVLWNGHWGAVMIPVPNSAPAQVLSFVRRNESDKVFAVFNFSAQAQTVRFQEPLFQGTYRDAFGNDTLTLDADSTLTLAPWQYQVLVR
ncbi:MAG: alpha-glucosidase C-terminal domain-containing protein, partial [Xanthomonadaceae bacterium]|nr:alpha-glucosidase C-terminal domain-containing protein [Xanthomonadaceae bacterium]